MATVTWAPLDAKGDSAHTVMYNSGRTDPIMVRVGAILHGAADGGSEVMLSSPSVGEHSRNQKKDKKRKKKRQRRHS